LFVYFSWKNTGIILIVNTTGICLKFTAKSAVDVDQISSSLVGGGIDMSLGAAPAAGVVLL
jgi:hypothetical protein